MLVRSTLLGRRNHRSAFTLIELLVTIAIITTLAAIALPTLRNSLKEQRIARSAGLIQQYIEEARARAIGSGRPVGVVLERYGTDGEVNRSQVGRLKICTSPPQYVGDFGGSIAEVRSVVLPTTAQPQGSIVLWFDPATALLLSSAAKGITESIQVGDYMLLGHDQVPRRILQLDAPSNTTLHPVSNIQGVLVTVEYLEVGYDSLNYSAKLATDTPYPRLSYAVLRQPTLSYATALEIPDNTVIDLLYSGVGPRGTQFSPLTMDGNDLDPSTSHAFNANITGGVRDYMQIWIVFAPDGSANRIYMGNIAVAGGTVAPSSFAPLGDIHLLVGRTGQVRPESLLTEDSSGIPNLLDPQAVWITINRMSGGAASSPNEVTPPSVASPPLATPLELAIAVGNARKFARGSRN